MQKSARVDKAVIVSAAARAPKPLCSALVLISILSLSACDNERELNADEIRALFLDKTVEGYHEVNEYHFRSYYATDGTFRSYQGPSSDELSNRRNARWRVRGQHMCIRWDDKNTELCRKIIAKGSTYLKVKRSADESKTVVTYERFRDGNPHSL